MHEHVCIHVQMFLCSNRMCMTVDVSNRDRCAHAVLRLSVPDNDADCGYIAHHIHHIDQHIQHHHRDINIRIHIDIDIDIEEEDT